MEPILVLIPTAAVGASAAMSTRLVQASYVGGWVPRLAGSRSGSAASA
jgi:hypothetical protein